MNICEPCTLLEAVEQCTDSIIIGIAQPDTDYFVYILNLATNRLDTFEATSDGDGLITISIEQPFASNTGYEVWVNTTTSDDPGDDLTIDDATNKCFIFSFMKSAQSANRIASIFNGMYVNGFTGILGNSIETNKLKLFIPRKKINYLTFYIGDQFLDSGKRAAFRTLVVDLRAAGQTRIGSNVTKKENCIDNVVGTEAHYNAECTNANQKINVFTQEGEPWHENDSFDSFAEYKANDDLIREHCRLNDIIYDVYWARSRDVAGVASEADCADQAVLHDTVHVVDYCSKSKFLTYSGLSGSIASKEGIKYQLYLLAMAAKRANKVQKFTTLFASEGNDGANMGEYYAENPTLLPSQVAFKKVYDAWNDPCKQYLDYKGQKIYAYTGIKNL